MKAIFPLILALALCACETQEHHAAVMQRVRADTARRQAAYGHTRYVRPVYYDPAYYDLAQQRRQIDEAQRQAQWQRDWAEIRQQERDAAVQSEFNHLQWELENNR